jgi:hypothetical protein
MQPLFRVKSSAPVDWGRADMMALRPNVAIKIAECIGECADMETALGMCLGMLLDTDSHAALAMFASVENRNAQRSMLLAAAQAKLDQIHLDLLMVVLKKVSAVMKERDKLAHWSWAFSPIIPDALLLTPLEYKMTLHFQAVHRRSKKPEIPFDPQKIFVVTEDYLSKLANRLRTTRDYVTEFMATIWKENTDVQRGEWLRKLSNAPPIREALDRLVAARQKNQVTQPLSRPLEPNEEE